MPRLEHHEVLVLNQHQWKQKEIKREATSRLASYKEFENKVHQKSVRPQDVNITSASVNSNSSEISRVMEKITETNQLIAQQQVEQQGTTTSTPDASRTVKIKSGDYTEGSSTGLQSSNRCSEQRGFN